MNARQALDRRYLDSCAGESLAYLTAIRTVSARGENIDFLVGKLQSKIDTLRSSSDVRWSEYARMLVTYRPSLERLYFGEYPAWPADVERAS
jgi:cell fate regulator YaaT (PSP1 superfamily)